MYKNITQSDFIDAFTRMGRADAWSYDGLCALYDYLEEIIPDTELDVIMLDCEYTEYTNMEEFQENYDDEYKTLDDVENETTEIRIDNDRFIIANF